MGQYAGQGFSAPCKAAALCLASALVFGAVPMSSAWADSQNDSGTAGEVASAADAGNLESEMAEPSLEEEAQDQSETAVEEQERDVEGPENSWRYKNGELVSGNVASLARTASNAWQWTSDGYVNSAGEVIDGATAKGIDVSQWQGRIDWQAVKNDGIDFAIIRCGYGGNYSSQDDTSWIYNVTECERLGIPYGVYLYSYATDTTRAESEALHALRLLKGHSPSLPVYLDMEDNSTAGLSNEMLASIASTFCNALSDAGYRVGVYANLDWWNNKLTSSVFGNWDRWVAQWNDECTYSGDYSYWQCSSQGTVKGISGYVDLDFRMGYGFSDVFSNTPHCSEIEWLASEGISTGFPDGTFRPLADVARQDMAAFLYRLAGSPSYTPTAADATRFSDVSPSTPHYKEIMWLASVGITEGFPDGTYRPMASVARQDMAAFLRRTYDYMTGNASRGWSASSQTAARFDDVSSSTAHAEDIWWLAEKGITTGFGDGTYRGLSSVVRQDMAAFLYRTYDAAN